MFFYPLAVIVSGGLISLFLPEKFKGAAVSLAAGIGMVPLVYLSLEVINSGNAMGAAADFSYPIGTVNFAIDPLSSFFIILISLMSFIGSIYSMEHTKMYHGKGKGLSSHFFFLSLLIASMLLLAAVQNALLFLVVWEVMSFSSYLLMTFENEKDGVYKAGINYLISMHVGVIFLMSGFAVLAVKTGSYDFNSFRSVLEQGDLESVGIFFLIFAGFGMKSGFIPLYTWLPGAYSAAPAHVSAIMSGVMKKTGIYGIFRFIVLMKIPPPEIAFIILAISLITGITGVAYAVVQKDLKRVLAYSSIENIGIAGTGMGLGLLGLAYGKPPMAVLGFTGALIHVFNHSIFKPLLFFSVGNIFARTGSVNMEKLGGLIKPMAFTGLSFLIGSLAVSGLPFFNGFTGEFMIYWSMFSGLSKGEPFLSIIMIVSLAGLASIGAMAIICFTRAFSITFLGSPRSSYDMTPENPGLASRLVFSIQIFFIVIIGIFPQYVFMFTGKIVSSFIPAGHAAAIPGYFSALGSLSSVLFIFLAVVSILFIARFRLLRHRAPSSFKTWDCGYQAGNTRMQYTGSSFAAPFMKILRPLYSLTVRIDRPAGLFPDRGGYDSTVEDNLEKRVIYPVINGLNKFLNAFTWIQSGSTQQYIMYGLLFLIATVIWIMAA